MAKQRIWPEETLEKRELPCRVCGKEVGIELAHVTGRIFDRPRTPGAKTVYVEPESVVPLCGPALDPASCHYAYDSHALDLLPYLELPEELRAIEDLGSIGLALKRLSPDFAERSAA